MKTINLRDFYAALYNHDALYDVPDEVAELLILFKRREEAQRRRIYRNRAYYSLDHDNCIEKQALCLVPSAETMYQSLLEREALATALSRLTPKQQQRIYQHFALEMNYLQIAKAEGVCESSVRRSVDAGIRKLKIQIEMIISFPRRQGTVVGKPNALQCHRRATFLRATGKKIFV